MGAPSGCSGEVIKACAAPNAERCITDARLHASTDSGRNFVQRKLG
jgi:hypothetical protein